MGVARLLHCAQLLWDSPAGARQRIEDGRNASSNYRNCLETKRDKRRGQETGDWEPTADKECEKEDTSQHHHCAYSTALNIGRSCSILHRLSRRHSIHLYCVFFGLSRRGAHMTDLILNEVKVYQCKCGLQNPTLRIRLRLLSLCPHAGWLNQLPDWQPQ